MKCATSFPRWASSFAAINLVGGGGLTQAKPPFATAAFSLHFRRNWVTPILIPFPARFANARGPDMLFLDFNLPNPATWFYLSLMLAVGLYFRFNRFFNLRNWDVLSLYLLVPGFLFLQEAMRIPIPDDPKAAVEAQATIASLNRYGFAWLMAGSGWFFLRCMLDMTLVSRPAMIPNLNLAGLAWFGAAMFVCMVPVAIRTPSDQQLPAGKKPAAIDVLDKASTQTVEQVQQITGKPRSEEGNVGFWVAKSTALLCHLAVVAGLVLIGAVHFQNTTSGMAAGTFYLLLPYTAYHVGQAQHALPAALLVWRFIAIVARVCPEHCWA